MSADVDADPGRTTRYGVFLRPDPLTCWVQAQVNTALVQQFGVVSAAAFPPHATLVGNLRTEVGPDALVGLLEPVLDATAAFTVSNAGIVRLGGALVYDVHGDATGRPNRPLVALAEAVRDAVLAVSLPIDDHLVTPVEDAVFHGHLSLASHDLVGREDLADEIEDFLRGLPLAPPPTFTAEVVTLLAFEADWTSAWWHAMTWRHLRSWRLHTGSGAAGR